MEQEIIKKSFNKRLLDLPDSLGIQHTVFDNEPLKVDARFPYQRASLHPIVIENYRDMGFYQIALSYPSNYYDSTEIETMAKKIKDHFHRGFIFVEGNDKIIIERHPDSSPPYKNNKRLDMTIRIRYYCF